MHIDTLNAFYKTRLGKNTRVVLGNQLAKYTQCQHTPTVLGVGYANPYLRYFFDKSDVVMSVVPDFLGTVRWPRLGDNKCISAEENYFPLQNNSIDIAVVVHGLEFSESPWGMMAELNRVMPIGGQVIVIVPNRVGVWAQSTQTPFGHGRPFTKGQLHSLMQASGFSPVSTTYDLFYPPMGIAKHKRIARICQTWGKWFLRENGGVIIGIYEKQQLQTIQEKSHRPFAVPADKGLEPVL